LSKKQGSPVPLAVVFDAGLPRLPPCQPGCEEDERRFCIHRFPSGVQVLAHTKTLEKPGLSDLKIIKYALRLAGNGHGGTVAGETPWVIMTTDKRFWNSARHEYWSQHGRTRTHLRFDEKNVVYASIQGRVVRVDIVTVRGRGTRRSGAALLRWAAAKTHQLLQERPR
jgi:hypothetical protein